MTLGPHIQRVTDVGMAWARQAGIVKSIDTVDPFRIARNDAIRIFRHWVPNDGDWVQASPLRFCEAVLAGLGGYRHPLLYVNLLNEVAQFMGGSLSQYVTWTAEATRILHDAGLKVAGFSFSTGNPGAGEWQYLASQRYAGVDAISLHEYWGTQGFTLNHALRHRWAHHILGPNHPPFVIDECGRDLVEGGLGGYLADGLTPEQFTGELEAYNAEISKDRYVLGATPFTCGPEARWVKFNCDIIQWDRLLHEEVPVTESEFIRWASDVFARAGVPFNQDAAITKFWLESARHRNYLGRPEGPEHPTENERWVIQEFSSAVLHYDRTDGTVEEGIPFA